MKQKITIVLFLLCYTISVRSFNVFDIVISPANPTTQDSIIVTFKVAVTDYGLKFSDNLNVLPDSVLYEGCYVCGCIEQTDAEIDDTIRIHQLAAGVHPLRIMARFATSQSDTLCNGNPSWFILKDTFFIVTAPNAIEKTADILYEQNIALSPNPTTSRLSILPTNPVTSFLTYQILRTDGRLLLQNKITTTPNFEIDVSTLPPGLYFLQLQDDRHRWVKKFVKQ